MKKFLSVTLSLLLAASMPLSALAETYDLAQGSITVEAKADGNQYVSQTGGVQQEQQTTETVIHQTDSNTTSTTNTITIQAEKNQTAEVTISDVNIDASSEYKAAISTGGDGSVTIELDGSNTAKGGFYHAGVEKNNGGNLTITDADGDGALNAIGGSNSAGIGGGYKGSGSDITISGNAEVTAKGGNYGAGIGGGDFGSGSNIKISDNAEVTANGGGASAGIGGGYKGSGSDITISGSAGVAAIGGNSGAGIGGGYGGSGSDITISGNAEVITAGGKYGAGIGGGPYGNGEITPNSDGLTNGFIAYYDSNANMETSAPKKLLHNDPSGTHTHTGVTLKSSTAATCTTNAMVTYLCSCGAEFTTELLGTAGHKMGEYTSNNDATCMADGTKTAHCTTPGCTYYVTVTDVGTRNPDKHSFTNYVSNNDATCLDAGHKTASCDNGCGATDVKIDENAPALGHTWGTYESNGNATCEQDGTKTAKCVRYGQDGCTATDTVSDVGSKLGHDFEAKDYVSNGDATCEQDGTKTAKCVRYGKGGCTATDTVTDVGSKLGHDFEAKDYVSNGDATCEQDGTKTAKCVRYGQGGCTATDTVTDVGSKLNHEFKDYVSNGDATCEQDGTKTAKCVRYGQGGCTATDTVPDTGSKLGHDFTDYIYNDNASYTEDGTETAHCNHAGCNETNTRKAEGTRWALFQVKDEKGWYVAYTESRSGNVLTITVNQNTATLSGTIAGLLVLQASGITTVIFKTTEAESTFHIADLLSGTSYNLTHKNTAVDFNLDGNDVAALLK